MIRIETRFAYDFAEPSDVLLQVEAAMIPEQYVVDAHIDISQCDHFARVAAHDAIGERIWLRVTGRFTVDYRATVRIDRVLADIAALSAVPFHRLPGETVQYLMASRYCPSDLFEDFVRAEFGTLRGGAQIAAMRDWIEAHFTYEAGSSTSATTAMESFVQRKGVCRGYAPGRRACRRGSRASTRWASTRRISTR